MAEVPEVEIYTRQMREVVVGRTFTGAEVIAPETVRFPAPAAFVAEVVGARVVGAERRAKWLLLALSGGRTLALHMMLFGSLRLELGAAPREGALCLALRLSGPPASGPGAGPGAGLGEGRGDESGAGKLGLAGGAEDELRLLDRMRYARVALAPTDEIAARLNLDTLGPDALAGDFTPETLERRIGRKRTPIKPTLLDQRVVAGMGNRDADESLWRAAIDPRRPAGTLSHDEAARLTEAMRGTLREGLSHGGTMPDLLGHKGSQWEYVQVFERAGKPCPRCGAPIQRLRLQNRNTFACLQCQR